MNQELKTRWIEALRRGGYAQGTEFLRTCDNKYCCLGVLADMSDLGDWNLTPRQVGTNKFCLEFCMTKDTHSASSLGTLFYPEQFGLTDTEMRQLIDLNDQKLLPFNQIADWVETNL